MDYVVYGTGYGATLMLLGYALRMWGPKWRFSEHEEGAYDRQEFRSAQIAWTRFTSGLGATVATCGAVLVLFTFLIMAINPGNGVGVLVALIVSAAALLAVAGWAWLYFDRYGVWGVLKTPEPLSSYQPLQYDPRAQSVAAGSVSQDQAPEELVDEGTADSPDQEDELYEPDEDFEARYSKYQSHHPDGEITVGPASEEGPSPDTGTAADEDEVPAETTEGVSETDDTVMNEDAASEPPADESPAEEIAGEGENQTVQADDDPLAEAYETESVEAEPVDAVEVTTPDEAQDTETLNVLPEAHETAEVAPGEGLQETGREATAGSAAGGRDDALRRLRERRAQRQAANTDDA